MYKSGGMSRKKHQSPEAITSNPEMWKRYWLEAKKRSPVNRRELAGEGAEIDRWNARACGYAEQGLYAMGRNGFPGAGQMVFTLLGRPADAAAKQ